MNVRHFWSSIALAILAIVASQAALANTEAGTVIQNQATVEYTDENGNNYNAQSNVAQITVAQIYSATLTEDRTRTAAAGQTVYFQHTLTNTGNGEDTYTITAADTPSTGTVGVDDFTLAAADDNDFTSFKIYHDTNSNGQVDAGEPELTGAGPNTISLEGAYDPTQNTASIVIEALVPVAAGNTEVGIKLSVAAGTGDVTDLGTDRDTATDDGTPGTNDDVVTIVTDAVLNITKSSVFVPPTGQDNTGTITYTITVTNTGTISAKEVVIWDAAPEGTTNVTIVDNGSGFFAGNGTDADVAAFATPANETAVGYSLDGDATNDATEADLGVDLNNDGDTGDNLSDFTILAGFDQELPSNTTISFQYSVDVSEAAGFHAGDLIKNVAYVSASVDGDTTPDPTNGGFQESNEVVDTYPQFADLEISDTGANPANDVNDAGDDIIDDGNGHAEAGATDGTDLAGSDIQFVNAAPAGTLVEFTSIVTNFGNDYDSFELEVVNDAGAAFDTHGDTPAVAALGTYLGATGLNLDAPYNTPIPFPTGTVFTFWDATGNNQLINSVPDAQGRVDVGPVNPEYLGTNTVTIIVKALLPADADSDNFHAATVIATSVYDDTKTDTKVALLGPIAAPEGDLKNEADADHSHAGDSNNTYQTGDTAVTTQDQTSWTTNIEPGMTITFPLRVTNNGGVPDAFQLSAGATWNPADIANPVGAMYSGWSVEFKDGQCDAEPSLAIVANSGSTPGNTGNTITTTPAIPASGTLDICALVTISVDPTEALADYQAGTLNIDGNGDGDEDYPIFFRIESLNSDAADVKMDAVDVNEVEDVVLIPNNSGQVQPGGSIDYNHTLSNNGNTTETFNLTVPSQSQSGIGFNNSVMVSVDPNGDGDNNPTTFAGGESLVLTDWTLITAGTKIVITDTNGNPVNFDVTTDSRVTLAPDEHLPIVVRVFAPASAPGNTIDDLTVQADYNTIGGAPDGEATATDQTVVILGQVRLYKKNAVDADCNGVPDVALAIDAGTVEPTQCVVYQIVAVNEGDAEARLIVIYDAAPAFTQYVTGTLSSCKGGASTSTDIAGNCVTGQTLVTTGPPDSITTTAAHTDAEDAAGADNVSTHQAGYVAHASGNSVEFYVGSTVVGAPGGNSVGGTLLPGESATVRFTARVD